MGFFLLLATGALAQQLHIVDGAGQPIKGIEVNSGTVAITDANGNVQLRIKDYPTKVTLSGPNYETLVRSIRNEKLRTIVMTEKRNSLTETVVTGVARPVKQQNAFSLYRIITKADNVAQGNINLADALATKLNITVGNDQLLGATVRMQGMQGNKVKILIDGLPVNGREAGNVDMSQLNLNNVDRIEVVQGPMSVVYGSDALGGVVNLITRKTAKPWEASAGFNYESVGKYNADFNVSRKWKHHQLLAGGGRNYFQGYKEMDTTAGVPHRRLLWKPKEQYFGNVTYNYTAASGFKAQLATDYLHEKITNLGDASVSPYAAYSFDEYYRTNRLNNRLILEKNTGKNGRWESRNSYSVYYRTRERVIKDLVALTEKPTTAVGDQDTSRYDDINLRANYSNLLKNLKYDVGYDVSLQRGISSKIPDGAKNINDYALYQNFSYAILQEKLTLKASLRESINSAYTAPLIYSVQALYAPVEKVQIRASYAKGFRTPSIKEQYLDFIDQNHMIFGNKDLKPETGNHLQASLSYQPYKQEGNYVQLIVTGFYNDVNDQIALAKIDPDPLSLRYIYSNIAHQRNVIANVQLEQQWNNIYLILEYGLTHTYSQPGYDAFNASEFTARANYYWKTAQVTLNAFYKFTGATANVVNDIGGIATYSGTTDPYQRLDASASRKFFNKKIELVAGVKNIFDVQQTSGTTIAPAVGPHTTGEASYFLPRSFFSTIRVNLN